MQTYYYLWRRQVFCKMINWYEKVKDYFLGGYYTEADVNKFVALKKITRSQADEIIAMKEAKAE